MKSTSASSPIPVSAWPVASPQAQNGRPRRPSRSRATGRQKPAAVTGFLPDQRSATVQHRLEVAANGERGSSGRQGQPVNNSKASPCAASEVADFSIAALSPGKWQRPGSTKKPEKHFMELPMRGAQRLVDGKPGARRVHGASNGRLAPSGRRFAGRPRLTHAKRLSNVRIMFCEPGTSRRYIAHGNI